MWVVVEVGWRRSIDLGSMGLLYCVLPFPLYLPTRSDSDGPQTQAQVFADAVAVYIVRTPRMWIHLSRWRDARL